MSGNQLKMTSIQRNRKIQSIMKSNQFTETDPEMMYMLELIDKGIKTIIICIPYVQL